MYLRTAISSRSSLSRHGALQSGCISVAPAVLFDLAEPQAPVYAAAPRALHRDAPLPGDEGIVESRRQTGLDHHLCRASLPGDKGIVEREGFFGEALAFLFSFLASGHPTSPSPLVVEGGWGNAHRGRFSGKPLRAISRFSHQNTPSLPSPLVGKGGCSQGEMFWQAPACHLPFQPSGRLTPPSPLVGEGG